MLGNLYPVKYVKYRHNISADELRGYLESCSAVARVLLKTDVAAYAVKADRTIFPVGTFETALCTPELKYALECGHIKAVYECVLYEQAEIFTSFVKTLYKLRLDFKSAGVTWYDVFCKYILNSFYGKFGQKAENWIQIGKAPNEPDREEILIDAQTHRRSKLRYMLGYVYESQGTSEAFNSFPAISAHVTAFARMYLWELMQVCGQGNYVYCDTDSLIVNDDGLDNLSGYIDDKQLGKLKHEETVHSLVIRGLKDYSKDTKRVVKGVRLNATKLADDIYSQEQWPSFKGLLKSGDANVYLVGHVVKHLSREYTKGVVTGEGWVTPYRLETITNDT
jgi:DNA polymerase elongation subunit (family B)